MERFFLTLRALLSKRETAALVIGISTLAVVFFPLPLFALVLLFTSYLFGYELELITKRGGLRYLTAVVFLFSLISPYLGLAVSFIGALLFGYREVAFKGHYSKSTFETFAVAFISAVYGGVVPYALVFIKGHNLHLLLALLLAIWAGDTFAYYVGKKLGKTPFFREISPKKTLEGFLGGLVAGTFVGVMVSYLLKVEGFNPLLWFFVVKISVLGDLFESFLKRSYGVKDSSDLLGSHGGFLDRFDALLLASLVVAAFLKT